ncbi:MAG: D-glycerate dehydrogenase [Candidatus Bathyarchaeia archaeon]
MRVLSTVPLPMAASKLLEQYADLRISDHGVPCPKDTLIRELSTADAVIADGLTRFDKEVLDASPRLKIIARYGVGYDNVDVSAATSKGIYVTFTPGVLSDAVAELTIGLMICLARKIPAAIDYVRSGSWKDGLHPFPLGYDLCAKTLGIVGLGRIGEEVAMRANAFKMRLLYHDRVRKPDLEEAYGIVFVTLEEVLKRSDVVTLHLPLSPETERLIGMRELRMMKRTAYLINTSRGGVVDQQALTQAVKEGTIAGAALDVLETEPIPLNDPIRNLDNVIIVPHIGSATVETRNRMALTAAEDVIRVLKGEKPINILNLT